MRIRRRPTLRPAHKLPSRPFVPVPLVQLRLALRPLSRLAPPPWLVLRHLRQVLRYGLLSLVWGPTLRMARPSTMLELDHRRSRPLAPARLASRLCGSWRPS
jgi:hypothetical protein